MEFAGNNKVVKVDEESASEDEIVSNRTQVEIEMTEDEPTFQQKQAYKQFWKLFIERIVTTQQLDKKL